MAAAEDRLAAVERELAEISHLAARMCEDLAALRASIDAHLWRDRLDAAFGHLAPAAGTRTPARRPRPRHLHLVGCPEGWAR
jgi:hypothetical protein